MQSPMRRPALSVAAILLAIIAVRAEIAAQASAARLSGVAAANAFWPEVLAQPSDSQTAILGRYTPALTIDTSAMPQSRVERLSLGEAMFLSFRAPEAHAYYASVADGGDLVARLAEERLMQIRYRAFSDSLGMRALFDDHYTTFPPSVLALRGRSQQVHNLISGARSAGRSDAAVTLLLEELEALPGDAPYRSFGLPRAFTALIRASSRADEVVSVAEMLLVELRGTFRRWSRDNPTAGDDPQLRGEMPAWFWAVEGVRPGETFHQARLRQLRGLIIDLDRWLDEVRGESAPGSPPGRG